MLSTFRILLLWLFAKQVLSSTGGLTSPIRHWDASWTASCAQGTSIAMAYDDCIILFLRSPSSNVWKPPLLSSKQTEDLSGLSVMRVDASSVQFAPSWLSFSNSLCSMTGLASDVEHLGRILQRQADNHFNIYLKPLTTHAMTQRLSRILQQAAQMKGGRPFGVQTLLVGGDDIDNRRLCLYTIDPSGSWQSWGGATVIGKYAKQVRQELAKKRKEMSPTSLKQALEQITECWIETCKQENVNLKAEEDYQVLILRKDAEKEVCQLFMADEDEVLEIVEKIASAMRD